MNTQLERVVEITDLIPRCVIIMDFFKHLVILIIIFLGDDAVGKHRLIKLVKHFCPDRFAVHALATGFFLACFGRSVILAHPKQIINALTIYAVAGIEYHRIILQHLLVRLNLC